MASQVQTDQALEYDCETWPGRAQENQQAGSRAPISHHIKDRTEGSRLVESPGSEAIERIEQTGDAV